MPGPSGHKKDLALLAFLVLEPGAHTRDELATLLWADTTEERARASLRQALKRLRVDVGPSLATDRSSIALTTPVPCDATAFQQAAKTDPAEAAGYDVPRFLAGFAVKHAPAFDEWVAVKRSQLVREYLAVLTTLARDAMVQWRWRDAAGWADRALEVDPLSDEAARIAVEAWYLAEDRGEALSRYADHERCLVSDLATVPSASLQELKDRIESDVGPRREAPISREWSIRPPTLNPPLVGRTQAWESLVAGWRDLKRGRGQIVILEGGTGTGKSRLADELLRWCRAEGATVLRGEGHGLDVAIPYGPVADALRQALEAPGLVGTPPEWLSEAGRLLPEIRQRFDTLPAPTDPTDGTEQWRLFEGISQLVLALAEERPVVLVLDDMHQFDGETCALLHFLARRWTEAPVLMVVTYSSGEVERGAAAARLYRAWRAEPETSVIQLAPLSAADVGELIRDMGKITSPELGTRFCQRVYEVTKGNPFYVLELLKALFDQGVLVVDPSTGEWNVEEESGLEFEMPRTIRETVAQRLARLPYQLRDLLTTVAVARIGCTAELLAYVNELSRLQVATLCDELVERLLLVEDGGKYRTAHPLVADVIRRDLSESRLAELHRALALGLDETAPKDRDTLVGRIARHAEGGGLSQLAYRNALLAAQAALQRLAFDEALTWLDLAASQADAEEAGEVDRLTGEILRVAGWTE
ncbi:MAG: AAA family ATPase, partial [Gemmatimonadales bacterium]